MLGGGTAYFGSAVGSGKRYSGGSGCGGRCRRTLGVGLFDSAGTKRRSTTDRKGERRGLCAACSTRGGPGRKAGTAGQGRPAVPGAAHGRRGKSVEGAFFSGGKAACYEMRHRCGIGSMCYPGLPCGCHRQKRRRSLPGLWPLGGRAGNGFDAGGRLCFNPWENAGKLSAYAPLGRPAGGGKKRWNVAGLFWCKCYWRQGFWYADHCGNDNWELPRRCVSLQRRWNGGQPHKL